VMMSSKVERRAGWRTEKGGVGGMRRVQRSRDFFTSRGYKTPRCSHEGIFDHYR
jgi:hypothetical protein